MPPVWMLTCPERRAVRDDTLARWARLGIALPEIVHDTGEGPPTFLRARAAYRAMLARIAVHPHEGAHLVIEDDLDFAPGLPARLAAWAPPRRADFFMGTLYRRLIPPVKNPPVEKDALAVDPARYYGAQALLISRALAAEAAERWDTLHGSQSERLGQMVFGKGGVVWQHVPSLVEHRDCGSLWGVPHHRAVDF